MKDWELECSLLTWMADTGSLGLHFGKPARRFEVGSVFSPYPRRSAHSPWRPQHNLAGVNNASVGKRNCLCVDILVDFERYRRM